MTTDEPAADRILTVPNVLSFARLLGVPVFLWLVIVAEADVWALILLVAAGVTDWLDGAIARWTGQFSRLGALLDPVADRLYIAATVIGLAVRGIIPWWLVLLLALRDVMLLGLLPILRSRGMIAMPVTLVGKAATFCLLWGFPFLLLGAQEDAWGLLGRTCGWAFVLWGTGLYWWAGLDYLAKAVRLSRSTGSTAGP
jgi:cardiolipin synthase